MNFTTNRTVDGAAPMQQAATPPAFHPQIVRSVRMHPLLAAGVGGLVFLMLLGYGLTRKPTYKAESRVFEEPAAAKLLSDGTTGSFDAGRYDSYLDQQKQIIIRPDVLGAAIASLPAPVWQELGPTQQAAVGSLQAQLKTERVKSSYELSISLESSDPAATAAIVNAVTKAYLDTVHKENSAQSDQRAQLLAEERSRIEGEMQAARQEQSRLSASLGVASASGETANPYDFEIAGVRQQLLTAREAHDVAAAQLNSISGGGVGDAALTAAADEAILGDPALASMRATVASRRAALNEQMAGMKPENPVYKQDLDELADLDKTLDTMTRQLRAKAELQLQEKLRTDLERTGDIEARMNSQLARLTATATTAAPKLQRAAELSEDLTRLNTRYAAVDDALRSLQLEANGPGVLRLSLAAAVPSMSEPSRKLLLLAAAPILGAILGIAAAVFARKRDPHVYSARDVEDILGFAPIAVLPAKNDVSSRVMDEYILRLAAGLEGAYRGNGAQTFLLTAASPTTDIRPLRKALTAKLERLGLDIAVANTTDLLLADPLETSERRLTRSVDGAGFVSGHLANLKGGHALVIINAPPLGTSAEAEYVARCADATILVAESGVTTQEELFESARLLQRLEAKGVGAVLQGLELRLAGEGFRHAVDAVEHRQPDIYNLTVRTRVATESAGSVEPSVNYVVPRQRSSAATEPFHEANVETKLEAVVAPDVITYESENVVERETTSTEEESEAPAPVESDAAVETFAQPEYTGGPQSCEQPVEVEEGEQEPAKTLEARPDEASHEKVSPNLLRPREISSEGGLPMSGSKNWFQRLLHREEEKVSILSGGEDDQRPLDEASFLTSRISRSVPAYEAPAARSQASNRFVLADLQSFEREHSSGAPDIEEAPVPTEVPADELAFEGHDVIDDANVEPAFEASQLFVVPSAPALLPTPLDTSPEPSAVEVPLPSSPEPSIVDFSATGLLSRLRPARPMSFHELEALSQREAGSSAQPDNLVTEGVVPEAAIVEHVTAEAITPAPVSVEAEEEVVHAVELPRELAVPEDEMRGEHFDAESSPESIAAEQPLEDLATAAHVADEPVMEEPVAAAPEIVTENEHEAEGQETQDQEPGAITREIARITSAGPIGTSRWDPIQPLRPTDSGWNRMHAINGGNGNGNGSHSSENAGTERRRSDDWAWTSQDNDAAVPVDAGAQRWAEQAASAELDEPTLSRPWGLLSRFQQAHLITPTRGIGASNGAGKEASNGSAAEDHELERGSLKPNGNG